MSNQKKTGAELIKEGIGLIARGMYRIGASDAGDDPNAAFETGMAVVATVRAAAFDFANMAKQKKE